MDNIQDTQSLKMSQEFSAPIREKTSELFLSLSAKLKDKKYLSLNLKASGSAREKSWEMISPWHGESLMRNIFPYPKGVRESSLSQILEDGAPAKYYLSPRACQGILNRATSRGKELPPVLKLALERQAAL